MKKIQEEMIKQFREKFVMAIQIRDRPETRQVAWNGNTATPETIEAFLLKWSEKLLAEERAECEHEPQIVTVTDNVPGGQYTHSVNGDVCSKCGELLT